jgi:hypothetical protein
MSTLTAARLPRNVLGQCLQPVGICALLLLTLGLKYCGDPHDHLEDSHQSRSYETVDHSAGRAQAEGTSLGRTPKVALPRPARVHEFRVLLARLLATALTHTAMLE